MPSTFRCSFVYLITGGSSVCEGSVFISLFCTCGFEVFFFQTNTAFYAHYDVHCIGVRSNHGFMDIISFFYVLFRKTTKEGLAQTSTDITKNLMSISRMMAQQVNQSEETITTLGWTEFICICIFFLVTDVYRIPGL